jgi:hypothetical protein
MKFRQYAPLYDAAQRATAMNVDIRNRERLLNADQRAMLLQAEMEEEFIQNRRPYYRMYPGVTEALTRLGIEKIDVSKMSPPVSPLSLEFPVDRPLIAGSLKIANILFTGPEDTDTLFISYRSECDTYGSIAFSRANKRIEDLLEKIEKEDTEEAFTAVLQIVFGVCMISQSDTSLITPRVLNRDLEKYESTGDIKYVDRARRNGVNGWDVGRDIPTQEEMEAFRQQSGEPGRKSPHWRMGHFAIRHIGEGRTNTTIVWIGDTFVNKALLKEVPTGYHGSKEPIGE